MKHLLLFAVAVGVGYTVVTRLAPYVQSRAMAYTMDMDNVWDVWGAE